jgi:chromosome segregation ATPase
LAIGIGLRQVQQAIERKASTVQKQFIDLSDELDELGRVMLEVTEEERNQLREQQRELRARQQEIAEEVNLWRTRARAVMQQPGANSVRSFLNEMLELNEPLITPIIEQSLQLLDLPPDQRPLPDQRSEIIQKTPAARLIERARTDFDLRGSDPGLRLREAVTFANRQGIAQDDTVLEEISAAIKDADPLVREVAALTTIQIHRFRALRYAELDRAHESVQALARMNELAVIPVLIEIVAQPRIGYIQQEGETVQAPNARSRMVALLRLVEWHTSEAQAAIRKLRFDQDEHIVRAAERALELFPDAWAGPLKPMGA